MAFVYDAVDKDVGKKLRPRDLWNCSAQSGGRDEFEKDN
jgi:hypothetical protein